jgi:putative hydrolase of the HAD superfamily
VHRALLECCPETPATLDQIRVLMREGFTWHTPDEDYSACTGQAWWARMFYRFADIYRGLGVEEEIAWRASRRTRCMILRPENYTLYPDALDTLDACREMGWRNFVLSNNYPELPAMLEALGLSQRFDGTVVSAREGWDKPRRELFERARTMAGNPQRCVMIGDNPVADIAGAKAAGMEAILVHGDDACPADSHCAELRLIPAWLRG